jgi:hypothetical protein
MKITKQKSLSKLQSKKISNTNTLRGGDGIGSALSGGAVGGGGGLVPIVNNTSNPLNEIGTCHNYIISAII